MYGCSLLQQPYFVEGSKALTDTTSGGEVAMWARLASGVTPRVAEQELLALTNQLRKLHPKLIWDGEYIVCEPGGHGKIMRPEMYQVAAMVGALVMLISGGRVCQSGWPDDGARHRSRA